MERRVGVEGPWTRRARVGEDDATTCYDRHRIVSLYKRRPMDARATRRWRRFPFSVSLLPYTPYHAHARRTPRIEHQNPLSFRRMIHPSFERSAFFHFR